MTSLQTDTKILHSEDGTIIYAEATGAPHNPHVVLLAGLSLSGCIYDDLCADPQLLETLYIVRYDVRGHGRSGKPTTPEARFQAVMDGFKLHKPFSWHAAVATDISAHLPPATLSGVLYLAGVPCTGELLGELVAPGLAVALPGLLAKDDVAAFQTLTPEIMSLSLNRPMDVEALFKAGRDGLPLLILHGSVDGHRMGGPKTVEDVLKPNFKNFECVWLEGRGHALHEECPQDVVHHLIKFTQKVSGKARLPYCVNLSESRISIHFMRRTRSRLEVLTCIIQKRK
ncbi:alpha/beta-hydrolase [Mycena leptocephala]|nr:alpha/beta-hydrolase [Mycena leptocephala]